MLNATGGLEGLRDEADFNDDDIIRIGFELASGKMSDKQLLDLILECDKFIAPYYLLKKGANMLFYAPYYLPKSRR